MPVNFEAQYADDVLKIVAAFADVGESITPIEADYMWRKYSENRCASWLVVDDIDIVHELADDGLFEYGDEEQPHRETPAQYFTNGLRP